MTGRLHHRHEAISISQTQRYVTDTDSLHGVGCSCLHYYAALLPRRGPHIASHSVCLSVRPVIVAICNVFSTTASVTSRHLANYNDTHVLFGTH